MAEQFDRYAWELQVWTDPEISFADKGMALGLLRYAGKNGELWATYDRMSEQSGHSVRSIAARMKSLVESGHVKKSGIRTWCVLHTPCRNQHDDMQESASKNAETSIPQECGNQHGGMRESAPGYAETSIQNQPIEPTNRTSEAEHSEGSSTLSRDPNPDAVRLQKLLDNYGHQIFQADCEKLLELGQDIDHVEDEVHRIQKNIPKAGTGSFLHALRSDLRRSTEGAQTSRHTEYRKSERSKELDAEWEAQKGKYTL